MLRSLIFKKNSLFIKFLLVLVFSLLHGLLYFYPDLKQNLIIDKDFVYTLSTYRLKPFLQTSFFLG